MAENKRLYSVHIELPNAREIDGPRLQVAMWLGGFRQVFLSDGVVTQLPSGSFIIASGESSAKVRANARSIAEAIDPTCRVQVAPMPSLNISLLPPDAPAQ